MQHEPLLSMTMNRPIWRYALVVVVDVETMGVWFEQGKSCFFGLGEK